MTCHTLRQPSAVMRTALREVKQYGAELSAALPPDLHGPAWLVYRHPERYRRIPTSDGDIYVEHYGARGYDKHFWIEAEKVDAIRSYLATERKKA